MAELGPYPDGNTLDPRLDTWALAETTLIDELGDALAETTLIKADR